MLRRVLTSIGTLVVVTTITACAAKIAPSTIVDAQLGARVKSALVNDPDVGVYPVEVRVANGVARLTGRVPTDADASRVVAIVRGIEGVVDVLSELRVGGEPDAEAPAAAAGPGRAGDADTGATGRTGPTGTAGDRARGLEDGLGDSGDRRLLAIGASFGWNGPHGETLDSSASLGPLVRLGNGRGLGLTVGFGWFGSDLRSALGNEEVVGQVRIRPVMGGLGYTVGDDRATMALSVLAGVAINSIVASDDLSGRTVPLRVGNSLVWRPGASFWFDTSSRTAINVSLGYVMTRPRLTLLADGEIERRLLTADAFLLRVGLAYKLF